jgi:hypothetical protein
MSPYSNDITITHSPVTKATLREMHRIWSLDKVILDNAQGNKNIGSEHVGLAVGYGYGLRHIAYTNGIVTVGHAGNSSLFMFILERYTDIEYKPYVVYIFINIIFHSCIIITIIILCVCDRGFAWFRK